MFIKVYASGTNVQRLAKGAKSVDGVIYSAYCQIENEPGMIKRKFFATYMKGLKEAVEELNETVQPSWLKIWEKPNANKAFIEKLFQALVGENSLTPELNLTHIADDQVDCFMLLVSANNKEMSDVLKIAKKAIPDWEIIVLNGDYTSNKEAESETTQIINESRLNSKKGVIIIANQMGSRSYSISEIQASVIAYDRGSVDATTQKVSRCLTPGNKYNGEKKEFGYIVDLSFDPNRAENIERLILEEAIQVQRSEDTDFTSAVKYVLNSIDLFKVKEFGYTIPVTEEELFGIFSDNDAMLRVADMSVDLTDILENGVYEILQNIKISKKNNDRKEKIGNPKNTVTQGGEGNKRTLTDSDKKEMEAVVNAAIRSLNMSATSVYDLANSGESYRECLTIIENNDILNSEFRDLFGIQSKQAIQLLDQKVLNEPILDVIVQNSRQVDLLFT